MSAQNPTPDDLRTIADNLKSEGQTSRAEVLYNAAAELQALREAVEAGLREAVTALYFRDSSDFGPALWSIVKRLGGEEAAELLEADEEAAYLKYVKTKGA
jgi:protein subunit release factor A